MVVNLRTLLSMQLVVTRLLFNYFPVYQKFLLPFPSLLFFFFFFLFLRYPMCFWALHSNLETIFSPSMFLGFKYWPWTNLLNDYMFMPLFILPYLWWLFCFSFIYPWSPPLRSWWSVFAKKLDFVNVSWLSHFHMICIFVQNFYLVSSVMYIR